MVSLGTVTFPNIFATHYLVTVTALSRSLLHLGSGSSCIHDGHRVIWVLEKTEVVCRCVQLHSTVTDLGATRAGPFGAPHVEHSVLHSWILLRNVLLVEAEGHSLQGAGSDEEEMVTGAMHSF